METFDLRLQSPFTLVASGGTSSGKTYNMIRLVNSASEMIYPPVDRIILCYSEWQKAYDELKNVEFHKGINEEVVSEDNLKNQSILLLIDDLSDSIEASFASRLFSVLSHHRGICVYFLLNNLFFKGLKSMRDITLNTHYFLLQKSFRDQSAVTTMARQMFGTDYKRMTQAYADVCKQSYGYLLIDCRPSTHDSLRLRTHIFPGETPILYISKNGKSKNP